MSKVFVRQNSQGSFKIHHEEMFSDDQEGVFESCGTLKKHFGNERLPSKGWQHSYEVTLNSSFKSKPAPPPDPFEGLPKILMHDHAVVYHRYVVHIGDDGIDIETLRAIVAAYDARDAQG